MLATSWSPLPLCGSRHRTSCPLPRNSSAIANDGSSHRLSSLQLGLERKIRQQPACSRSFSVICAASADSDGSGNGLSVESATQELKDFITGPGSTTAPADLDVLVGVLQAQGKVLMSPGERGGMLPLVIPIAREENGDVVGLLRWPTAPDGLDMPVVQSSRDGLWLLAKSGADYVLRATVEEDVMARNKESDPSKHPVRDAVGPDTLSQYSPGDFESSGQERLDVYITVEVGKFPDVVESLANHHEGKGDTTSALITGEWYCRQLFPGFGRPYSFNAQLYERAGRMQEARDSARIALRSPWWTLGCPFEKIADLAGFKEQNIEYIRDKLSEEMKQAELQSGRSPEQIALDQAAFLMDRVSAEVSISGDLEKWDSCKTELQSLYREARLADIAEFVGA